MGIQPLLGLALFCFGVVSSAANSEAPSGSGAEGSEKFAIGEENLAPWATGLLKLDPAAPSSQAKFPLILAEKRTRRPDFLRKFKIYKDGWDITDKHYWASVGFTGASGFILALLWFISFGLALGARCCWKWGISINKKSFQHSDHICLTLLLIFTSAASIGCILLSVGQNEFHGEVMNTLSFVVNQSDTTVQILRNVTEYLSLAKNINIDKFILPPDVQKEIDRLKTDLTDAASTLSVKTTENSVKIKQLFGQVRSALIVVAAVMLLLAVIGFLLSIFRHRHAIYIFVFSGWLLVSVTFILCGVFMILNGAILDTCTAMDEWVHNPLAETTLSDILPCVDQRSSNLTLHQSKEVIYQLVNVVNTAIWTVANPETTPQQTYYYNQTGPLMPSLCSPYDSQLNNHQCSSQEVSFSNASVVWLNYTCTVSSSGICTSPGRVTPEIYNELVAAVNASYALDHYTPLLLSLRDCNFVRDTFGTITTKYCPLLGHNLRIVNAGLGMISAGVMLCLILWIFYANRPQREEVFVVKLSEIKISNNSEPKSTKRDESVASQDTQV